MTAMERRLAQRNLRAANASAALRRRQANIYCDTLGENQMTMGIRRDALPQSHFPIRVHPDHRASMTGLLNRHGFETGAEFPLSGLLPAAEFPGAARIASEIITLPLGEQVSETEVRRIAELVSTTMTK